MARFNAQETENYGGGGGHGFFSLANDKDVAQVRFMYNGIDDVEGYAVHEVEIDGRKRYVNCLRTYDEPVDNCPFCRNHMFQTVKFYIPLYDIDSKQIKLWERGKKFISKLSSLCSRYPNLVSHIFEIERNGKKGEQTTTYEIYDVHNDNTRLEDLPEVPEILGGVVLDKTYEDMEDYIATGRFRDANNAPSRHDRREPEQPQRRESSNNSYGRRTPATSERREAF